MNLRRTRRIAAMVSSGQFVAVHAQAGQPPAAAKLLTDNPKPIEAHWQFIRALVELKDAASTGG